MRTQQSRAHAQREREREREREKSTCVHRALLPALPRSPGLAITTRLARSCAAAAKSEAPASCSLPTTTTADSASPLPCAPTKAASPSPSPPAPAPDPSAPTPATPATTAPLVAAPTEEGRGRGRSDSGHARMRRRMEAMSRACRWCMCTLAAMPGAAGWYWWLPPTMRTDLSSFVSGRRESGATTEAITRPLTTHSKRRCGPCAVEWWKTSAK